MKSNSTKKTYKFRWLFICLLFAAYFITPEIAMAQYITLPHQFDTQEAYGEKSSIQGYLISRDNNPSYYNIGYAGFRYFIPPGTIRVTFYFTTLAVTHGGPEIYAASRFNAEPQATRNDFINQDSSLPELRISSNAATMSDLQSVKGYMGQRVAQNGEQVWIHSEYDANEILPPSFRDTGGYVYVKLLNRISGNTVNIRTFQGSFEVISSKYNSWRNSMNFPSPEPAEPVFDFSIQSMTNAELNQQYTANVSFSNFEEEKNISISGGSGQYKIGSGEYTSEAGKVQPNQSVTVRLTSAPGYSRTVETTLTIGNVSKKYQITTKPDPENVLQTINFNPSHIAGVSKNTWIESSDVDIVINASISISAGGEYKINNSSYTSAPGTVKPGDRVRVRLKSSDQDYTSVRTTLNIGSASGIFTVSTARGASSGAGEGILPDICATWPSLPQCNGGIPQPQPEPEPEREIRLSPHLKRFNNQDVSAKSRNGNESLELVIEMPSTLPESTLDEIASMFALLEIPGRGLFLAQTDIFGNIFLFPYQEGDPIEPYRTEQLNGQSIIETHPFISLQDFEYTAEDLANLGAVFYVAIVPGGNWDKWLGSSFRFTGGSGDNDAISLIKQDMEENSDPGMWDNSLKVESGYLEFNSNIFQASDDESPRPLRLDIRLPHGWEDMLGEDLKDINPAEIDWTIYALIKVEHMPEQQFMGKSDIHVKPRLVQFNNFSPIRPATWTMALSAGSAYIDLFSCIDELQYCARDFARSNLGFYIALVPQGNWNNFFGVHFTFQE